MDEERASSIVAYALTSYEHYKIIPEQACHSSDWLQQTILNQACNWPFRFIQASRLHHIIA